MKKKTMKKGTIWLAVPLLIAALSGCASVPDTEDGSKAVRSESSNQNAKELLQDIGKETDLSAYDFLEPEQDGYRCRLTLAEGENEIKIDAPIDQDGLEEVPVLTVKVLDQKLDEEKLKDTLLKGLSVYDATDEVMAEFWADKDDPDYQIATSDKMKYDGANHVILVNQDDGSQCFERSVASISYSGEEYGQVKAMDRAWAEADAAMQEAGEEPPQRRWFSRDIREDFTEEMAWEALCSAMEQLGITDLKKVCGEAYCDAEGQEGYYAFTFTRCMEGIPLMSGELQAQRHPLCVIGYAEVTPDGVADIQADNVLWETISSEPVQCMNAGQFIELVRQYLKDGRIRGDGSITFDHVELAYRMVTEDWETAEFKPVWRMYVPLEELLAADGNLYGSVEFCVDAVTGEIVNQISY